MYVIRRSTISLLCYIHLTAGWIIADSDHPRQLPDIKDIYQRSNDTRTNNEELHLNVTSDEYPSIYNNTQQSQLEIEKSANEPSIGNSSEKTGRDKMTVSRPPPCPVGFIRYKNSCYHIVGSSELTWSIANTYCQLHGSKLVEIESESEQRFIANMIKVKKDGEAYWIGATNRLGKGNWRWESTSEPLSFTMWTWNGWIDRIESPSCALIDTTESNQWMFWPCEKNFFMTGKKRSHKTGIGLICEKESPRNPSRRNRHSKSKRKRRHRRKGRRNWHIRHWKRFS